MAADEEQLAWFRAGAHYHAISTILAMAQTLMKESTLDDAITRMKDAHIAVDKLNGEAMAKDMLEYALYEGKRMPFQDQELLANLAKAIIMVWEQ